MQIGIHGGNQVITGGSSDAIGAHAAEAEADGFSSYWLNQPPSPDILTVLTVVGRATSTIELGTAVIPTWTRHPLMLAAQALTTQEIVGNRLVLGIGLAHKPSIEDRYAIPFEQPAKNMDEYLSVLLPAVRERSVHFEGDIWTGVDEGLGGPPGVESPSVMLAAMGPRMLELAGGRTDGSILWLSGPRTVRDKILPALESAASSAGRDAPRVVASVPMCVTDNPQPVRELVSALLANYNELPSYRAVMDFEGVEGVADISIIGSADEVREGLDAFASAGTTDFAAVEFTTNDDEQHATRDLLKEIHLKG
jgi:5,10-methylenetetrahydromethanopterin reductase